MGGAVPHFILHWLRRYIWGLMCRLLSPRPQPEHECQGLVLSMAAPGLCKRNWPPPALHGTSYGNCCLAAMPCPGAEVRCWVSLDPLAHLHTSSQAWLRDCPAPSQAFALQGVWLLIHRS